MLRKISEEERLQMIREDREEEEIFIRMGLASARNEGREEGVLQGCAETALRMKEKGFEYEVISEMTKLSVKEIEQMISIHKTKRACRRYLIAQVRFLVHFFYLCFYLDKWYTKE